MKKITILLLSIGFNFMTNAQCVQKIDAGYYSSYAIRTDGTLWSWGRNSESQLGIGGTSNKNSPINIGNDNNWESVSAGYDFVIAKKTNGTLWSWGSSIPYGYFVTTQNNQIGTDNDWQTIVAGGHFALAIKNNGTLWAWGSNYDQTLGDGTNVGKAIPVQISSNTNWQKITGGISHSLAIQSDGSAWAWGRNDYGQLGNWTNINSSIPVAVGMTTDWSKVAAGSDCSFGIKTNGTLWAWGRNNYEQLGIGSGNTANYNFPIQVGTANNWSEIVSCSAAYYEASLTYALKTDGTIWKRANGTFIQLGTDNDWQKIDIGIQHVMALKNDGSLWVLGNNFIGQLGLGQGLNYSTNTFQMVNCATFLDVENFEQQVKERTYVIPNPSKDEITFVDLVEESNYRIINSLGQIVKHGTVANNIKVDIGNLANGIYYVKVNQQTIKLIKY